MRLIANIEKTRGGFSLDVDLDLEIRGVTGLFGRSGAGKTTLLRCLTGLEQPDSGEVVFGEKTWLGEGVSVSVEKRRIGYVSQKPSLFPHLNVSENIEYGAKRFGNSLKFRDLLDFPGLSSLAGRDVRNLSGGEQQRVAIARALAIRPELLIMDEPLASLDEESKREIIPFLSNLMERIECPVIYVSHSISEMARFADRLILLEEGSVTAIGSTNEILTGLDLPLASSSDAVATLNAEFRKYEPEFGVSELAIGDERLIVPVEVLETSEMVKLRIAAADVSVTLVRPEKTSIQNVLPATVESVLEKGSHQVIVRLMVSGNPILARITKKSLVELNLEKGQQVFAQIKSVALHG